MVLIASVQAQRITMPCRRNYFPLLKQLIRMKLITLILFTCCLHVNAHVAGQGITLNLKKAPLQKIFASLTQQTDMLFLFTEDQLKGSTPIDIFVSNETLDDVLKICFKNQPLTYKVVNNTIVITRLSIIVFSDTLPLVHGIVTSAGQPLQGVSVFIKNTKKGTVTIASGEYLLSKVPANAILVFSSVGFDKQEVSISNLELHDIELTIAVNQLDQTLVIAYGTSTKRYNTGNVSKVSGDEISRQPVPDLLSALQGRVAGLDVNSSNGTPGSSFVVRIRGQNSIANGNDPLYIIDGVPFILGNGVGGQPISDIQQGGSPLSIINPGDIASIEILKDADATAIYGSRAANGVILITTKRGKAGKTNLDINMFTGSGSITHPFNLLNTKQYLQMRHEAFANDGATPQDYDYDVNGQWDTTRNTDWQKQIIGGTAKMTDAQVSLSGGSDRTNFQLSAGYRKEGTVFPLSNGLERTTVHFSSAHVSANNKFKVTMSASYNADNNDLPSTDPTLLAMSLSPDAPEVYDSLRKLNWANSTWINPYSVLLQKYQIKRRTLLSNLTMNYALTNSLTLKLNAGFNDARGDELSTTPVKSINPEDVLAGTVSRAVYSTKSNSSWIIEPQLYWQYHISKHNFETIAGVSGQQQTNEALTQAGTGYLSDNLMGNIKAAASIQVNSNNFINYRYFGAFGRITYQYDRKYLLNVSGRRDGSSRFGPDHRFENFGALGAGWIFSAESFIQKMLPFVSFGKLRISYGTSGNDQIGDYQYLDLWSANVLPYAGSNALIPERLFNPDYHWEVNKKFEAGLELGFLKDRIFLQVDYYRNRSGNQLVGLPLPLITGFGSVQSNLPATVQNTGLELELNTINISHNKFNWQSFFNLTIPKNLLVSYPNLEGSAYNYRYIVGKSLYTKLDYHYLGLDPISGIYQFMDVNKDGEISFPEDLTSVKQVAKTFYGGLRNQLTYKNFRVDLLFQFVRQTGYGYLGVLNAPGFLTNQPTLILNNWKRSGDHKDIAPFTQDYGSEVYSAYTKAAYFGDNTIVDASYIRLKNISIDYTVPISMLKKVHIQQLRIYLQGQNLFTITSYKGLDPETQSLGTLPSLKMITAGLQIKI
jgi:TonB-linked SusC/RagA family outer membrane protein